jgi:hypothetical protein
MSYVLQSNRLYHPWFPPLLAVTAPNGTSLIADGKLPATMLAAAAQYLAAILATHSLQKAMLSAARNAFRLPCSLGHRSRTPYKSYSRCAAGAG